jgi:uncharacterized membrane protein
MTYLLVKWLHVLSSTLLFGTGIGSAFLMFVANRRKDLAGMVFAARHVVIADWCFTAPSVIFQLISGALMMRLGGLHITDRWIAWGLTLYFFAGLCWIPVVWMQIRMRDMAKACLREGHPLPARYWVFERWWCLLGALAFPAVMVIFWLMVVKPE